MRAGATPVHAAESVIRRILQWYPGYVGALVAVNRHGEHGAAAHGWKFQYSIRDSTQSKVRVIDLQPLDDLSNEQ